MKKKPARAADTSEPERWSVVQVSAYLRLPYQRARNNMLSGDYGRSYYDEKTRSLTVLAARVQAARRAAKKRR